MSKFKCLLFSGNDKRTSGQHQYRPLGVHRISYVLREAGWDSEVIDYTSEWMLEQLKLLCLSRITKDTKFIGFSYVFLTNEEFPREFCLWLKIQFPWIHIIVGAQFIYPNNYDIIDYIISGYSEYALIDLLKYLYSNGKRPWFSRYTSHAKIIEANKDYDTKDLRDFMVKYEDRDFIMPYNILGMEFSRGCKFQCKFCNYPFLGIKDDNSRSAENFKEQVQDAYDRFGAPIYFIVDETFNDRSEKIIKFADAVEQLNFDIRFFHAFIRIDLMANRKKDWEHLARMKVYNHFYGIESFNHESVKVIGKGMDPEKIKQTLLDVKHYFENNYKKRYYGEISFIVGLPHETRETFKEKTENWILENWNDPNQTTLVNAFYIQKNDLEKNSEMSVDYKKYGYKEMTYETYDKYVFEQLNSQKHYKKIISDSKHLVWENEHWNFFDVKQICKEMMEKNDYYSKGRIEFQDVFNTLSDDMKKVYSSESTLDFYINKKLNWN
jgi:hypothetical protein